MIWWIGERGDDDAVGYSVIVRAAGASAPGEISIATLRLFFVAAGSPGQDYEVADGFYQVTL